MFENFENSGKYEPRWIGLRMLGVGAAVLLLSVGLCGVSAVVDGRGGLSWVAMLGFYLMMFSFVIIFASVAVTIVELILAGGYSLTRRFWDRSNR